jgi:hypothetical protein
MPPRVAAKCDSCALHPCAASYVTAQGGQKNGVAKNVFARILRNLRRHLADCLIMRTWTAREVSRSQLIGDCCEGTFIMGIGTRTIRGFARIGISAATAAAGIAGCHSSAADEVGEQTSKIRGNTATDDTSYTSNTVQIELRDDRGLVIGRASGIRVTPTVVLTANHVMTCVNGPYDYATELERTTVRLSAAPGSLLNYSRRWIFERNRCDLKAAEPTQKDRECSGIFEVRPTKRACRFRQKDEDASISTGC